MKIKEIYQIWEKAYTGESGYTLLPREVCSFETPEEAVEEAIRLEELDKKIGISFSFYVILKAVVWEK